MDMPSDEKDREGSILGTESGQEQPSPPHAGRDDAVVGTVGRTIATKTESATEEPGDDRFARQMLALGADGERALRGLRVGLVGAGGSPAASAPATSCPDEQGAARADHGPTVR
jgi:hypothetical protein